MAGFSNISVSLARHTGPSLRNLLNLIYSRASLLSKASGGSIAIDRELLDLLDAAETPESAKALVDMVNRYAVKCGGIHGVEFSHDCVTFTGFGEFQDAEHFHAYEKLAARMNIMALAQKRIQAKPVNNENEKYAMHGFLIRLGMNGADLKPARKILMERLSGSQAFRTSGQAEQAKERNAQRYRERRAAMAELPPMPPEEEDVSNTQPIEK
jgi:hypothetical protein